MRIKNFNLQFGSQILKAFGDESRIRIIHLLHKNDEMCISDLETILEFTQTKTSRHLIYLKNTGLVVSRKVDQWAYYSIKDEVAGFVETLYKYLYKDATLRKDQKVYEKLYEENKLAVCKLNDKKWIMASLN